MLNRLLQKARAEKAAGSEKEPSDLKEEHLQAPEAPLSHFRVGGLDSIFYVPDVISPEGERAILSEIERSPAGRWVELPHARRRLQRWGGQVTPTGLTDAEPLPAYAHKLAEWLHDARISPFQANHLLLNEYPAEAGIMPHTDGPAYQPFVCVFSLKSPCILHFSAASGESALQLLVWPRSLYVFTESAYTSCLHSIADSPHEEVLLRIEGEGPPVITASSVCNVALTPLAAMIRESQLERTPGLQPLAPGGPYTHSYLLQRDRRVSLTLRWVPPASP